MALIQQGPPPPPSHEGGAPNNRLKRSGSRSSASSGRSPKQSPRDQTASGKMRYAALQAPQCPVVHHAPSQPLPPGHPPTHSTPASSLKPPLAERCVFFRTADDFSSTPPSVSRSTSNAGFIQSPLTGQLVSTTEYLKEHANVAPLKAGETLQLDPEHCLVLASRNSQLALIQSSHVHSMLEARFGNASPFYKSKSQQNGDPASPQQHSQAALDSLKKNISHLSLQKPCSFPITSMSTAGDQNQRSPLYVIGGEGKAIWTKELEVALKAGAVDAIVHCLKDVPTTLPEGLELAAILEREDPRDALVIKDGLPYKTLDELPPGSVIGTSSVRRVAQLRSRYPKLVFSDVRGNLNTRLAKLDAPTGPYTALILAAAGLHRLSFENRVTAYLQPPTLYYSVGQGALAIEVRSPPPGSTAADNRDCRIRDIIRTIGCWQSTWKCGAERALLRKLEGGCSIPVGVDSWIGDQQEEERRGPKTKVSRKKSNADELEDVEVEGHHINEIKAAEPPSRPDLRRFETDQIDADAHKSASSDMPDVPRLPSTDAMSIEDIATPPSEGARLHLSSNVVSLDGTRRSNAYLSAVCHSYEDAIALGERVADILIKDKDARSILDEVERHRTLAEQADERRRAERKERLKQMNNSTDAGQEVDTQALAAGLAQSQVHVQNGVKDLDDEQQKLRQVIGLSDLNEYKLNGNGGLGYGEGAPTGEVDRRGVARDDGQPKAWEV